MVLVVMVLVVIVDMVDRYSSGCTGDGGSSCAGGGWC